MLLKRYIVTLLALLCASTFAVTSVAHAQVEIIDPAACKNSKVAAQSSVCQERGKGDPITGSNGVLAKVTRIISYVAGAASVILLIIGGFMYVLSNGDTSKITSARNTIIYALVGLVIVVIAQSIVIFVINRL